MPRYIDCDSCGEHIEGHYAYLDASNTRGFGGHQRRFYYHEGDCLERAIEPLADLQGRGSDRLREPEAFGLEWRLVAVDEPRREALEEKPLECFILNDDAVRRLSFGGIRTIGDLAGRAPEELRELPGVGLRTVCQAELLVEALGFRSREGVE